MLTYERINTEEDVRQIRLPESDKLDYKTALGERHDLCIDVSALANTAGGMLIVGVKEKGGVPIAWPGIEIPENDPDKYKLKIDDLICNGITPHPHIRIKPIVFERSPSKWFVVIEVPFGVDPPYMVTVKGVYRHYDRHDGRNFPMGPNELGEIYEKKRSRENTSRVQLNAILEDYKQAKGNNIYFFYWVSIPLSPPGLTFPIDGPGMDSLFNGFADGFMNWGYRDSGMDYIEYLQGEEENLRFYENGCVAHRKQIPYNSNWEGRVISSPVYRADTYRFLTGLIRVYSDKYNYVRILVFTGTLNAYNAVIVKPGDPVGAKYLQKVEKDFGTETGFYLSEIRDDSNTATDKLLKRIDRLLR